MWKQGRLQPGEVVRDALPLLERAIAESPNDARAWEAKAYALQLAGRKSEALAATRTVLSLVPDDEIGLNRAAALASECGEFKNAVAYWQKAVVANPTSGGYRQELATLLAKSGNWEAAGTEAREAARLDPARSTARTILAISESCASRKTQPKPTI